MYTVDTLVPSQSVPEFRLVDINTYSALAKETRLPTRASGAQVRSCIVSLEMRIGSHTAHSLVKYVRKPVVRFKESCSQSILVGHHLLGSEILLSMIGRRGSDLAWSGVSGLA